MLIYYSSQSETTNSKESSNMSQNAAFIEKEIPRIVFIPTEATDGSTATDWTTPTPRTPRPRSFTPVNDTHDCFRTPTNQTIHISYESLGLTTTEMRPMRDVLSAIEDDGAWDCQVDRPNLVFRLLVFLYGKGYTTMTFPHKSAFIVSNSAS
jgi:hypothetical protein